MRPKLAKNGTKTPGFSHLGRDVGPGARQQGGEPGFGSEQRERGCPMANALLPADWKKVLKDHKDAPDTAPVTKALDAYARVEPKAKDDPQPVLDALRDVAAAAKAARSANVKDKKRKPV